MDAITRSRIADGLNYYKDGLITLEEALTGIDRILEENGYGGELAEANRLLKEVWLIKEYQSKPAISNQGQCLDGFSALANYDSMAEKIKKYLEENCSCENL